MSNYTEDPETISVDFLVAFKDGTWTTITREMTVQLEDDDRQPWEAFGRKEARQGYPKRRIAHVKVLSFTRLED